LLEIERLTIKAYKPMWVNEAEQLTTVPSGILLAHIIRPYLPHGNGQKVKTRSRSLQPKHGCMVGSDPNYRAMCYVPSGTACEYLYDGVEPYYVNR